MTISVIAALIIAASLTTFHQGENARKTGFFQALSIITTTGYASVNFAKWPRQAETVLPVLMFIGGSAGSAAGGVKVVRWLILIGHTRRELRRTLHPSAVYPVRVGRRISESVLRAVAAFIALYISLFAFTTAVVTFLGADFITAFTASIACIGNIGPGLAARRWGRWQTLRICTRSVALYLFSGCMRGV